MNKLALTAIVLASSTLLTASAEAQIKVAGLQHKIIVEQDSGDDSVNIINYDVKIQFISGVAESAAFTFSPIAINDTVIAPSHPVIHESPDAGDTVDGSCDEVRSNLLQAFAGTALEQYLEYGADYVFVPHGQVIRNGITTQLNCE